MPIGYSKLTGENPFKGKKRPPFTKEHRLKMSLAKKGKLGLNKGKKFPQYSNKKHPNWKGDNVSYKALHDWINKNWGKATKCINGHIKKRYYWANISGEYTRDKSDWQELCNSCNQLDGIPKHERFKE